jgi:hypothetical protein
MKYTKEPGCRYNKGCVCSLAGRECSRCGWSPKEAKLRKLKLDASGLSVNSEGKQFLLLRKGDAECRK